MVKVVLMASSDLRGADMKEDIEEEEEVPGRGLGTSNRRETSLVHCV